MTDENDEHWRDEVPDVERIGDSDRISDRDWTELVDRLGEAETSAADLPVNEVRERLEEAERWEPGPAAPVGWRTASPTLVLSAVAALAAVVGLLVGVLFLRPLPGWYLPVVIALGLAGAVGLFFHLPTQRGLDDGDGAAV
ncbi:hypothetical protein DFO66_106139 [Brevibacterium sanguinis]|uniref:Uncharacterized protein n=2 Tax=Brevibacterium TaxID=1696 RepID=A0A366IJ34_9MICO|nr:MULTISPECIES: hypothetical protein [Brevibacterium]RBP64740.1 hypothetical protein DFO66_106139 [Brevibacterium sanguinis]RBP71617.1 hypothetical protein DFO65_105222 [Brevibacterium celere]